ncbi:MAG: hypothetical protein HQK84_04130 [Nitrospinae bacterium]|nr:hypothetical protein [Nitrospinota bacterium]
MLTETSFNGLKITCKFKKKFRSAICLLDLLVIDNINMMKINVIKFLLSIQLGVYIFIVIILLFHLIFTKNIFNAFNFWCDLILQLPDWGILPLYVLLFAIVVCMVIDLIRYFGKENVTISGSDNNNGGEMRLENKDSSPKSLSGRIIKKVSEYLNEESCFSERTSLLGLHPHERLVKRVLRRLTLRYAQLDNLERARRDLFPENDFKKNVKEIYPQGNIYGEETASSSTKFPNPNSSYKLAVTDLFVEKALAFLEANSRKYKVLGSLAYLCGVIGIVFAVFISFDSINNKKTEENFFNKTTVMGDVESYFFPEIPTNDETKGGKKNKNLNVTEIGKRLKEINADQLSFLKTIVWYDFFLIFVKYFTFYGFIVIFSVCSWRFGRAMLDQAERIEDKRHALRQGRLMMHLMDDVDLSVLEQAFQWNASHENAFGNMATDAKAPWGAVLSETNKNLLEMMKLIKKDKSA